MAKTIRILIVEDEAPLRNVLKEKLTLEGFTVFDATNGEEGVNVAAKEIPDIILMDIIMPHVDGFSALKQIKANDATKQIPVLMLTNLGQSEDIDKGWQLGAAGYLVKADWQLTDIIEKIRSVLTKKE